MRWWSSKHGHLPMFGWQCCSNLWIQGPPGRWDLIGQMWPAAMGEWNWLNLNKLCYSFDPPCTHLFSNFHSFQLQKYPNMKDLDQHQPFQNINISHSHKNSQMYNPSSPIIIIIKSSFYLSTSLPHSFLPLQCSDVVRVMPLWLKPYLQ